MHDTVMRHGMYIVVGLDICMLCHAAPDPLVPVKGPEQLWTSSHPQLREVSVDILVDILVAMEINGVCGAHFLSRANSSAYTGGGCVIAQCLLAGSVSTLLL